MRTEYKTDCTITTCTICNYTHVEYKDRINDSTEPFIELCEPVLYKTPYDTINRLSQYVCPNCGAIQVDVNEI